LLRPFFLRFLQWEKRMTREELIEKIRELTEKLADLELKLPAHSVRPHQFQEVEDVEEELEHAKAALKKLEESE
jgi:uncharacterized coiled-coil DUF342 family protein